jgi:hypothetical protein
MAQDRTAELEASLLQGARGVQNSTENMLERLAKMFTATDLVTIKNILPDPFGWVYTDPRETTIEQPDSATRRVNFGAPKAHSLDVGATKTIPGWEAYIALERMWKAYAQIDIEKLGFVLTSTQEMDSFLNQAFVGVFDPDSVGGAGGTKALGFEVSTPAPVVNTPADRTAVAESALNATTEDEDLGFGEETSQEDLPPVIPPLQESDQVTQGFNSQQNQ